MEALGGRLKLHITILKAEVPEMGSTIIHDTPHHIRHSKAWREVKQKRICWAEPTHEQVFP